MKAIKVIGIVFGVIFLLLLINGLLANAPAAPQSSAAAHSGPLHDKAAIGALVLSGGNIEWYRAHLRGIGVTKQGAICYTILGADGDYHHAWYDGATLVVGGTAEIGCKNLIVLDEAE